MHQQARSSVVSVHKADGELSNELCGGGVLVSGRYVVTCTHVVEFALGRKKNLLGGTVRLRSTFHHRQPEDEEFFNATVRTVNTIGESSADDLAILEVQQAFEGIGSTLSKLDLHQEAELECWSFHVGGHEGVYFDSVFKAFRADGRVQIQGVDAGNAAFVAPGTSGCGVFEKQTGQLVGIVAGRFSPTNDTGRTSLLIGADLILNELQNVQSDRAAESPKLEVYPKVEEDFDRYIKFIKQQEEKTDYKPDAKFYPFSALREPNFIAYTAGKDLIICVIHNESNVSGRKLTRSVRDAFELEQPEILPREKISELGYHSGFVHPFVQPVGHEGRIFVVVDACIFFQFLLFPTKSKVRFPCNSENEKAEVDASSFYRALLSFHGDKFVSPAQISRQHWATDPLYSSVYALPAFTRFAPTPNSSLHFGSIRNALASYIFYLKDPDNGHFSLRFDDTNLDPEVSQTRKNAESEIIDDLIWSGIRLTQSGDQDIASTGFSSGPEFEGKTYDPFVFAQTDETEQKLYQACRRILEQFGLIFKQGTSWFVDLSDLPFPYYCWLDLQHGPQIRFAYPTRLKKGEYLQNNFGIDKDDESLEPVFEVFWATKNTPRYRFAGAIDDMFHFTHVLRDYSQAGLTESQAALRQLVHFAIQKVVSNGTENSDIALLRKYSSMFSGGKHRSLPYLSPRIFGHTSLVVDDRGEKFSKSSPHTPKIADIRRNRETIPEAVAASICASFVPPSMQRGSFHPRTLARDAVRLQTDAFIQYFAARCDLEWITEQRRPDFSGEQIPDGARDKNVVALRSVELRKFDCWTLHGAHFWRWKVAVKDALTNIYTIGSVNDALLDRCYLHRSWFSSWRECIDLLHWLHRGMDAKYSKILKGCRIRERNFEHLAFRGQLVRSTITKARKVSSVVKPTAKNKEGWHSLRNAVWGRNSGPPIEIISWIAISE